MSDELVAGLYTIHSAKTGNIVYRLPDDQVPELLNKHQVYAEGKLNGKKKPLFLVFHGGSGSTKEEIKTAVENGVVKMNVDTDTQWAYLTGVRVRISPIFLSLPSLSERLFLIVSTGLCPDQVWIPPVSGRQPRWC